MRLYIQPFRSLGYFVYFLYSRINLVRNPILSFLSSLLAGSKFTPKIPKSGNKGRNRNHTIFLRSSFLLPSNISLIEKKQRKSFARAKGNGIEFSLWKAYGWTDDLHSEATATRPKAFGLHSKTMTILTIQVKWRKKNNRQCVQCPTLEGEKGRVWHFIHCRFKTNRPKSTLTSM